MTYADLTGLRYGRWTVESRGENSPARAARWLCRCDCGALRLIRGSDLRSGHSASCGCLQRERAAACATHGHARVRVRHPLYGTWQGMRQRCSNPNNKRYQNYGARGISVCDRWAKFVNFLADMGDRPPDPPGWRGGRTYYSLDRHDNDGNYEPSNCRWATAKEQAQNRRADR